MGPMPGLPQPGPGMYPPMPLPFPPPPPPRRGGGRWVFVTLLIIALGVSVLINLVQLGAALVGAAADVRQTVISGEGSDKIAVVPVSGLIDDDAQETFDTLIANVEKDSAVRALVVEVDTPGGSASASDEMYHRLLQFKNDKHVPVVIAMRGMATSGGYYLSAAGDYIIAEPGCLTGNIGVLLPRFNLSKLTDRWGVYESTLTATTPGHSFKNAGSMFKPPDPEDEQYLQGLVDGTFAQFKSVVQTGRTGKLKDAAEDIFSGKAFIAADALTRGLIDQIGYPDAAYDYAAHLAGISSKSVVKYTPNPSLFRMLTASSTVPPAEAKYSNGSISFDGLTIDGQTAAALLSARPLMLWRGN
jgi:protease IV